MSDPKTKPAPPKRAAKPRKPKPLDATAIRGALAQIEDHGGNNTARLIELLEANYGLKLQLVETASAMVVTMLGVTAPAMPGGHLAALQAWGRAARRALLEEGGR